MSKFDKVIGYESIKMELMQICDMIHNKSVYEKLGAKMPNGVVLYGAPGLGKSLMAKCFIEECGLKTFTIRKNKSDDFVEYITDVFKKAKENAPSIVFLDDMDKFANEDSNRRDAEEYVAVQAGIDDVKNSNVFVMATVNEIHKLPDSLIRSGRFDKKIEVCCPNSEDCVKIIEHYLSDKVVSNDVNVDDLSKMISYSSCAELETILNEAAILAAYQRKEFIDMNDLIKAVLRMEYNSSDNFTKVSDENMKKVALHEAGHLVVCEVLSPGSVGIASLRTTGRSSIGGFIRRCKNISETTHNILVSLAGKAAVELCYGICADGCERDINNAYTSIRRELSDRGTGGFGLVDVSCHHFDVSESFNSRNEAVVQAELERLMTKTRNILIKNREFLEKATEELMKKETLLFSDIRKLRESVAVTEVML